MINFLSFCGGDYNNSFDISELKIGISLCSATKKGEEE